MNKTTNKYFPEVRERAVRMVLDGAGQYESHWAAIVSISSKIGCAPPTINDCVKQVGAYDSERDGRLTGVELNELRREVKHKGGNIGR